MRKPPTIPKLKAKALSLYSELVKLKAAHDEKLICYTCDYALKLYTSNCQLGHYLSRGAYPGLTFHPNNSRVQCYRCNVHLHGNTIEFRERLINELGYNKVTELELRRHTQVKWSRTDLLEMIEKFSEQISEIK